MGLWLDDGGQTAQGPRLWQGANAYVFDSWLWRRLSWLTAYENDFQ